MSLELEMYSLPEDLVRNIYEFDPTYRILYKSTLSELLTTIDVVKVFMKDALNLPISEIYINKKLGYLTQKQVRLIANFTRTPIKEKSTKREALLSILFNVIEHKRWYCYSLSFDG